MDSHVIDEFHPWIAYRLEQEEKYRKFRPMILLYAIVGAVTGYVTCESIRDSKNAQKR